MLDFGHKLNEINLGQFLDNSCFYSEEDTQKHTTHFLFTSFDLFILCAIEIIA